VIHQVRRVVIPLDAAVENATAIDTAARLAGRWQVRLHAVFIEDEELWELAGLPFARQVSLLAGAEAMNREHLAAHFRAFAERARQAVAAAATRHHVEWSFATVRGLLAVELGEHDFVVASTVTRPIGHLFRLPRRVRRLPGDARSMLLARRDWQSGGSVVNIVRRRGPAAASLLRLAGEIAGFRSGVLHVFGTPDASGFAGLDTWVRDVLKDSSLQVATEISSLKPTELHTRLVSLDCRLVAIAADDHAELEACFAECDVLTIGADAG
jgi:hypothetical protein